MEVNPQYPDQTTKLLTTLEKHLIEQRMAYDMLS